MLDLPDPVFEISTQDSGSPYRSLLGESPWSQLPPPVRRRFSGNCGTSGAIVYRGVVTLTELSRAGWILAQLARLIGGPLPHTRGATGSAIVTVTDNPRLGGQVWTRCYARPGRFPQVIQSAKRFRGPTGLEEYLGYALVMRLTLHVEAGALVFRSAGFALELLGRNLPLPHWLTPGQCEIRHENLADTRFRFVLKLAHPWLGTLVQQVADFEEEDQARGKQHAWNPAPEAAISDHRL